MFNYILTACLFVVSFGILFLNEDRTVRRELSLADAVDGIVSMRHYQPFDKQHYGRVIHITGPLSTGEPLTEPDYNIVVQAVKLRRRVSMFQWVEQSVDPIGSSQPQDVMDHDDRKYYYTTEWHEKLIDSTHFYLRSGHQNPPNFPIEPITYIAEHVKVGEVELNEDIKRSFSNFILITSDTRPDVPDVKLHSGFYYHTDNIHEPAVGDVRLQFLLAGLEGTSYTVVGKLNNSGILEPYHSKFGHKVLIVKSGELSLDEVLSQEKFVLSINSWMMRALGTGLLFIAISKLTEVLAESRFPGSNTNFSVLRSFRWKSVRLSFTLATALLVMAIVWSLHKPLTGGGMFFCAAILYLFCVKTMRN